MKGKENAKMNDWELENVAGGQTFMYWRITGTWQDPASGKEYRDGYMVRISNINTGEKSSSRWLPVKSFIDFREEMESRGHDFIEGESNPDGVDSVVKG